MFVIHRYRILTVFVFLLCFIIIFGFLLNKPKLTYTIEAPEIPDHIVEEYDVIVIGGEPEGVAAAVSAARNGSKTLLVEKRDNLGGLLTFGMLNYIDMVYGVRERHAIGGIFEEWHWLVGRDDAFDIDIGKSAFLKLVLEEENLSLVLETEVLEPIMDGSVVTGVVLQNDYQGPVETKAAMFIDATQDADFAAMTGVPYFVGSEDINLKDTAMAVTLMLHLKGVDWKGVRDAAKSDMFGPSWITKSVAWGFKDLHFVYEPVEENTRLRGLNLVRVEDLEGEEHFYINALQIFGVDGLDENSRAEAIEKGKRETEHIVEFLRENFPGFENAEIASYPSEMYVRETRHIHAEYQLSMADIWANRDHWDSIGFGGYPVDVQANSVSDYGAIVSSPTQYAIPFRSLVPLEIDGLLVVGRAAGFSSVAAGSARIVPTGMASGQAAGVAAALSLEKGVTFRELSGDEALVKELRNRLKKQKAKVDHFSIDYPYAGEWFDGAVQVLLNYGLIAGGYENDLSVETTMKPGQFLILLLNSVERMDSNLYEQHGELIKAFYSQYYNEVDPIVRDELAYILVRIFTEEDPTASVWDQAHELGLIDYTVYEIIEENRDLTRSEIYYIIANLLSDLEE